MSKRHSTLLQLYSDAEASKDKTCRAFIHAFRIMRKIVEDKGDNSWLATGAPHCNVRQDFFDKNDGIKPRVQLPVYDVDESPYW